MSTKPPPARREMIAMGLAVALALMLAIAAFFYATYVIDQSNAKLLGPEGKQGIEGPPGEPGMIPWQAYYLVATISNGIYGSGTFASNVGPSVQFVVSTLINDSNADSVWSSPVTFAYNRTNYELTFELPQATTSPTVTVVGYFSTATIG